MSQGNFSRARMAAAAHQGGGRSRVVGRPVGALMKQAGRAGLFQGMNGRHFQCLFRVQWRHQTRQS